MRKDIRVAVVGIWNCASSLIQGVEYYRNRPEESVGLMHRTVGHYDVGDITFACGFDIDERKVGRDLSEGIFSEPNCTIKISNVPFLKAKIFRWPTLDGLTHTLRKKVVESSEACVDVVSVLKEEKADLVVSYLPTGSDSAAEYYARAAAEAGCGFINCMPAHIANDPNIAKLFEDRGLPLIWDDIKSQVWATILHRVLAKLFEDRGLKIVSTSQLNMWGNTDFLNFIDRSESKSISKKASLFSVLHKSEDMKVHTWLHFNETLGDQKWAHIYLEWTGFWWVKTTVETKLVVEDSPNSAGVIVDAIRCVALALDNGIGWVLEWPSAYLMKTPTRQMDDDEWKTAIERFIAWMK